MKERRMNEKLTALLFSRMAERSEFLRACIFRQRSENTLRWFRAVCLHLAFSSQSVSERVKKKNTRLQTETRLLGMSHPSLSFEWLLLCCGCPKIGLLIQSRHSTKDSETTQKGEWVTSWLQCSFLDILRKVAEFENAAAYNQRFDCWNQKFCVCLDVCWGWSDCRCVRCVEEIKREGGKQRLTTHAHKRREGRAETGGEEGLSVSVSVSV